VDGRRPLGAGAAGVGLSARAVTEAEARAALAAFDGVGGLERWMAEQPWLATRSGWTVQGQLQGWAFRVEPAPGGVRVVASAGGSQPATWWVPERG
jgi:hypothetical protein